MSTLESIKSELQEIIADSNATTGGNATTVRDGVDALIGGYGQGSGGGASLNIHYGDTEPTDTSKLWCKCEKPSDFLVSSEINGSYEIEHLGDILSIASDSYKACRVGKKIYVFAEGAEYINVFDIETNAYETVPCSLLHNTGYAVAVGTKIYLFGGSGNATRTNKIYMFNTETNTLETLSVTMPNAVSHMTVGVIGKTCYIFGGYTGSTRLQSIWKFNTETNTITTLSATLPESAYIYGVAVAGNKIYLFGGYSSSGNLTTIKVFDAETETISKLSTQMRNRTKSTAVIGRKIYLFGGSDSSSNFLSNIDVFDIETNTISTLNITLSEESQSMCPVAVGNKIYLFGGYKSGAFMKKVDIFTVNFGLEENKVQLEPTNAINKFYIMNANTMMKIGVKNIYRGNSDGIGELVESFLYQNGSWQAV